MKAKQKSPKKSRLKSLRVTFQVGHESFGGSEHKDGSRSYVVQAIHHISAIKKAKAMLGKDSNCYILSVEVEEI